MDTSTAAIVGGVIAASGAILSPIIHYHYQDYLEKKSLISI